MSMFIDETEYPQNYDWLTPEQQKAVLDHINMLDDTEMEFFKAFQHTDTFERLWREAAVRKNAAIDAYAAIGIKVEFGWIGHRSEYFLATYADAFREQDYYDDIARDAEGDVDEYRYGGDIDY
jgi:hypothetical protein